MPARRRLCEICGTRPASARVTVEEDGRRRTIEVCEEDYERLAERGERSIGSPFDSLFGGGLFEEFFGRPGWGGGRQPRRAGPRRSRAESSVDLEASLSDHTKELLQRAARKAVELGTREVDTEHLLHALTESDVIEAILKDLKISSQELRTYVDENAPRGDRPAEEGEKVEIEVSPRVKAALERAYEVSREMGHGYVGPEHLLAGLSEDEESFAGDLLRKCGVTPEAARQRALKVVGKGAEAGRPQGRSSTPLLDKYSRDLTQLAREGKLDPVIGRAREIETLIEVLARRKKNNPVLIGEPGVGKTAIVEGLAQRIVRGEVPDVLRNKRLVELSVTSIVAGTKYRGEFEERVKQLLDEIVAHKDELILFIDELHVIVGAGAAGGEGGLDIANTFKPALARGDLHLIGATTLGEYQKHIEKDAALERRFQPIFIQEPSVGETVEILRGLRDRFEAHHKVKIGDDAIVAAAKLSARYVRGRYLPDKAIDLIDQASARVRIAAASKPAEVQELERRAAELKRELDSAKAAKDAERVRSLESRIKGEEKRLGEATERWKKLRRRADRVTAEDVAQIVSNLTGVPVSDLTVEERDKLLGLEKKLEERVVGQDEAVRAVARAIRLARAGLKEGRRPIAVFLFLGPTGVGKTELAKTVAWAVFGDEDALIRVDMSEYTERHTVARLIGAPPGYVGYEEGGQLTERVRRRPYAVILLDEIEKAHPEVHNILLQIFDEGRLTDGKGRVVDFTNTVIIATSNIGSDLIQRNLEMPEGSKMSTDDLRTRLTELLRRQFRPEFLNRVDEGIVFNALGREQIKAIVRLQLERVRVSAESQGITLQFDDSLVEHLAEVAYQPEYGAREVKRRIRDEVETKLSDAILRKTAKEGDVVRLTYDARTGSVVLEVAGKARPGEGRADSAA